MLKVVLLVTLWALVSAKSVPRQKRIRVCYDALGCFSTDPPFFSFHRLLNFLPEAPRFIDPDFTLFTQQNINNGDVLHANDVTTLKTSHFSARKTTKVIVHGYLESGQARWLSHMKNEFLKTYDVNVIIVGWGKGSLPPYTQATANTRVVGAMIAQLITTIQTTTGAQPETFHIIGHSLGAHIAGYAGERVQHVGRITGLDPAEPYFQNTDIRVRLDPSDALFVDVIHTDGQSILKLGYGMKQTCGHVDYFPNGGMKQPGCDKGPITSIKLEGLYAGVKNFVACSHLRSHYLFTESINSQCPFEAYQCNSYDDFQNGRCMPCRGKGCGYMGLHADRVKPDRSLTHVKYFLETSGDGPFCRYHYEVQLAMGARYGAGSERGYLFINVIGTRGQTGERALNKDHMYVQPGMSYNFVLTSVADIGDVTNVEFRWKHDSSLLNPFSWNILNLRHPKLYLNKINVVNGHTSKQFMLCGHHAGVETDHKDRLSTSATSTC